MIKKKIHYIKIALIGVLMGITFLFFEPFIHVYLFKKHNFLEELFRPDRHEMWMRSFVISLFILFGFYAQNSLNKREELKEKFRKQSEFLNTVIEALSYPFYVIDVRDYAVKIANRAARKGTTGEIETCYHLTHRSGNPCGGEHHICPLEEVKKTKQPAIVEHIHYDTAGNAINAEVHGYPIFDENNNVIQMIECVLDITRRRQAEKELIKTIRELERSNTELEQFAYVASHDLQEPLRMVASYVQLLEKRYRDKLDTQANEFINYAVEGVIRMQRLISDLLTYSRVGTRSIEFKSVSCEDVVKQVINNLEEAIKEKKGVVTYSNLPAVTADEVQLVQLFQNLISNAIKFSQADVLPRIQIEARRQKVSNNSMEKESAHGEEIMEWVFSVKDNGIGISPEHFKRIFVVFQRLHTRSKYPGAGMGLAICKKIVGRHGGQIWVESELGKGSAFYFTIPEKKEG